MIDKFASCNTAFIFKICDPKNQGFNLIKSNIAKGDESNKIIQSTKHCIRRISIIPPFFASCHVSS